MMKSNDTYLLFLIIFCGLGFNSFGQQVIPNDAFFDNQWGHHNKGDCVPRFGDGALVGTADCDADLPEAWAITTGSSNVVIAIIDTGVDFAHPELLGRFWINPGETAGNGIDDDNNGFVDDWRGWDFVGSDNNPSFTPSTSLSSHGTRMAGIAAANANNQIGVAGVNWGCKVMILKTGVTGVEPNFAQNTNDAIRYAADNGADLISLSYGFRLGFGNPVFGPAQLSDLEEAIDYALSKGVLLFAEPGNDDELALDYPAASDNTIAVGVHSPCNERKRGENSPSISCDNDTRAGITPQGNQVEWGSNFGNHIDLVAPGVLLPALTNDDIWPISYGASMSPPFAAGVAALMLSVNPGLTPDQIKEILLQTAVDIESPGYDIETGHGRINAFSAVLAAQNYCKTHIVIQDQILHNDASLKATNSLTLGQNVQLEQGVMIDLKAGQEIVFTDNFEMGTGSELTATIRTVECGGKKVESKLQNTAVESISKSKEFDSNTVVSFAPNPFSNQLNVSYELTQDGSVNLRLFDLYGRQVDLISNKLEYAGKHVTRLETGHLPTGMYLYKLGVGASVVTGRLIKEN